MNAGRRAAILSISVALFAGCRTAPGVEIRLPRIGAGGDKPPYGVLDPEDVLGRGRDISGRPIGPVPSTRVEIPVLRLPVVGVSSSFAMAVGTESPQFFIGGSPLASTHGANRPASSTGGLSPGSTASGQPPALSSAARSGAGLDGGRAAAHSDGGRAPGTLSGGQPMNAAGTAARSGLLGSALTPAGQWTSRTAAADSTGDSAGSVAGARPPHGVSAPLTGASVSGPERVSEAGSPARPSTASGAEGLMGFTGGLSASGGFAIVSLAGTFGASGMSGKAGTIRLARTGSPDGVAEARLVAPKAAFLEPAAPPAPAPEGPPLTLVKSADKEQVEPGDIVTFTIEYQNLRPWAIKDLVIQDRLSLALKYVPATATREGNLFAVGELPGGNEVLEWRIPGPVAPGAGGKVTFQARVR